MIKVKVRFYEELSDYLPLDLRKREFEIEIEEGKKVRDILKIFGIKEREVHLALVNGENSFLDREIKEGDRVSFYPIFETIDISPIKIINEKRVKESIYEFRGDYTICLVCERRCKLKRGDVGFCKTRMNVEGKVYTLIYGDISSICVNPIEKKPFFHFYPGTKALTASSWSCNFLCPWCQNYEISKAPYNIGKGKFISPEKFIDLMEKFKCEGTSISFNEPTLMLEYSLDLFKLAKKKNYYNTFVSNGYMTEKALNLLIDSGLDAINFDIKGNREFVKRYCGADLEKIWRNIKIAKEKGLWVEIITLVIEGYNDREEDIREIARRIRDEIGEDIPYHLTRYFPAYKFDAPPTSVKRLEILRDIAKEEGLYYVYIGNVPGHRYENTYCHKCGTLLIKRYIFDIIENRIINGKCFNCGENIRGFFKILES
ncbi:MAG: AmmeMemoRadiSam system radical SAM enzyme [candidate division WOR-3 bacterium]